jgi:hypothetical protein
MELSNKIYNISESVDVKFPIPGDSVINLTNFGRMSFFWEKSLVVLFLEVSPMLLTNARVN